jgi:ferredoxin
MSIKVEIELTERNARIFRSWASLGRFCDACMRVCPESEWELAEDITTLKPALMEIGMQLREKLITTGVKPLWPQ